MVWRVIFHPDIPDDLNLLGAAAAKRILQVIEECLQYGEPDKIGQPLRGMLAGCRKIRTGYTRIIYRVDGATTTLKKTVAIEVIIVR